MQIQAKHEKKVLSDLTYGSQTFDYLEISESSDDEESLDDDQSVEDPINKGFEQEVDFTEFFFWKNCLSLWL